MVSFPFPLYYSEKKKKNQYKQQTVNSFQNDTENEASTKEQILWDSTGVFSLQ